MKLEAIKTERLYLKVAAQLSNLITEGFITSGNRLPSERDLAEKLGVSRPTIREAMIAMELSGIVEIRTGSGIYVTEKPPALIMKDKGVGPFEILNTRLLIETEVCALAAEHITQTQISELKQTIKEMEEEVKRPDNSEHSDWKFHNIIADASQNSAMASIVNWLWELRNQSDLSRAFAARLRSTGVHPSIAEHKAIVEALSKGNVGKAREAMKLHIENATKAASAYFENATSLKIK